MTRRDFLKGLVVAGVVATTGVSLFDEILPKLSDYPGITYERDYIKAKGCYFHTVHFEISNTQWDISDFSHEKELKPEELSVMLERAKEVGYLKT